MDNKTNTQVESEEERRIEEKVQISEWEKYLNHAQLYTLGRLRNFGYDLKFVRYNAENLAIFSQDKEFNDFIVVDIEGDFKINPTDIVIRK